jgi:hypothetical protein
MTSFFEFTFQEESGLVHLYSRRNYDLINGASLQLFFPLFPTIFHYIFTSIHTTVVLVHRHKMVEMNV